MTTQEQIAALQAQQKYQLQVVPEGAEPYAAETKDTRTEVRQALAQFVDGKLQDGFEFGEATEAGAITLERITTEMRPVEVVERVTVKVVSRSGWDVLSADESDALLVAAAKERGEGNTFPVEWLPDEEQATERARRQPSVPINL